MRKQIALVFIGISIVVQFAQAQIPSGKIAAHYRADYGLANTADGDTNGVWQDKNGSGFNAVQTSAANKPKYYANQINGSPILRFDGNSWLETKTASDFNLLETGYELYIVARTSSTAIQFLFSGNTGTFEMHLNGGVGARFIPKSGSAYLDAGVSNEYSDNEFHIYHVKIDSANSFIRVDGVVKQSNLVNDFRLESNTDIIEFGKRIDNSFFLNGDFAELIMLNQTMTNEERAVVDTYLENRYLNPIVGLNPTVYTQSTYGMSTTVNNATISAWSDIRYNGQQLTQTSESWKPTYNENAYNNFPSVRFNGANYLRVGLPSEIGIQSADYEVFIVAQSSSSASQYLISANGANYEGLLNGSAGYTFTPSVGSSATIGTTSYYTNGVPHIFNFSGSSTEGVVRVDGAIGDSIASNVQISNDGTVWLGIRYNDTNGFSGDLFELLVIDKVLSESDRQEVETYLFSKYEIANPADIIPTAAIDSVVSFGEGVRLYTRINASNVSTSYYVKYGTSGVSLNDSTSVQVESSANEVSATIDIPSLSLQSNVYVFELKAQTDWQSAIPDTTFYTTVPNSYVVTSTSDANSGTGNTGTLRYVLNKINEQATAQNSTIFLTLISGQITMNSAHPPINYPVSIIGPGADVLTISGNGAHQPFFIGSGLAPFSAENPASPTVSMRDFAIKSGYHKGGEGTGGGAAGFGGALFVNSGNLTIDSMLFENNHAHGGNGGYNSYVYNGVFGGGFGSGSYGGPAGSSGYLGGALGTSSTDGGPGASGSINFENNQNATNGGFGAGGGRAASNGLNAGYGGFGGGGGYAFYGDSNSGLGGFGGGNGYIQVQTGTSVGSGGGAAMGGAIFIRYGNLTVRNSDFVSNMLTKGLGGNSNAANSGSEYGGAIANYQGYLRLENNTYTNNSAEAVFNYSNQTISPSIEPSVISGNAVIERKTTESITFSFSPGDGSSRLIVAKAGSAPSTTPEDETTYLALTEFGGGNELESGEYVVYAGSDTTITITGLSAATAYHFKIYEMNGNGFGELPNYKIDEVLQVQASTLAQSLDVTAGSYLLFNGNGSVVNAGQHAVFQPESGITLEAWIKPSVQTAYAQIVGNMWDTILQGSGYALTLDGNGGVYFNVRTSSQIGSAFSYLSSGENTIPLQTWTHVAGTYDGTTRKIYINGIEVVSSTDVSGSIIYPFPNDIRIGKYQDDNEFYYYNGGIDEVRIWNYARTEEEIRKSIYSLNEEKSGALVAVWTFNENGGTVAQDNIIANNGTLSEFQFNANDGWRNDAFRVYAQGTSSYSESVLSGNVVFNELSLSITENLDNPTDLAVFQFDAAPNIQPENEWANLEAYWLIKPFGDPGVFSTDITFNVPEALVNVGLPKVTQYKLYTRADSSVSAWSLIRSSAESVNGNQITFTDITEFGQFTIVRENINFYDLGAGNALQFDGVNDYLSVAHSSRLNLDKITIELWLKWEASSTSDVQFIIGKGVGYHEIHLGGSPGLIRFIPTTNVFIDSPANTMPLNEWVHLVCEYDPSESLGKLFLNGEELNVTNNGANPLSTAMVYTNSEMNIGRRNDVSFNFKGQMDELRVWKSIRTTQEIQSDMKWASPAGSDTNLVAYWQFNEGSGTSSEDLNNGLNAQLNQFDMNSTSGWLTSEIPINQLETSLIGSEGWFMLANPIAGVSFQNWLSPIWTQGFDGATTVNGSSNVFQWSTANGTSDVMNWQSISQASDVIEVGSGFLSYVFSDDNGPEAGNSGFPKILQTKGLQPLEDQNLSTLLNPNTNGWTLLGNPFSETIDWDLAQKSNLYASIYHWDNASSQWLVWNGTTGSLSDGLIQPNQAFFVQTFAETPSLTIPTASKTTNNNPGKNVAREEQVIPQVISLSITNESALKDQVFIQFLDEKTENLQSLAAVKQQPLSSSFVTIGLMDENRNVWSILPVYQQEEIHELPIYLNSTRNGNHEISLDPIELPDTWSVRIRDNETGLLSSLEKPFWFDFSVNQKAKKSDNESIPVLSQITQSGEARYSLIVKAGVTTSVESSEMPLVFSLENNYPNPFNPITSIKFSLTEQASVSLKVYDVLGREVKTLVNGVQTAGKHTVSFDGTDLASGVYIYRLFNGKTYLTKKMMLIK